MNANSALPNNDKRNLNNTLGEKMKNILIVFMVTLFLLSPLLLGAEKNPPKKPDAVKPEDPLSPGNLSGLKFRSIGPALTSGRIADFAVNPQDHSEYYVAVAAGNAWKTTNSGITWAPVFDNYGAWSIAEVEIDPRNPNVVWVGTGEYNSQRAIGYGDGVYRSEDRGKSWKNMGLTTSEHIGRIAIDPRNSHVYVAAQGPLWGPGGERGLYKSIDNGKTWKQIYSISENTGFTDIVIDPKDPDTLYAASYQRRRHVFTLINGGPESAIYKSTDAGATWTKLTGGLPMGDVGRIGLAISPANPDVIYAIIEAEGDTGGFFCSMDRGVTWEKRNKYTSGSAQYYNRIFADPKNVNKVFSMDTVSRVSEDGGRNFRPIGNKNRHVDDHAFWIDPNDTRHLLIGGDGGIYETFDSGENWLYKPNLPVTQFYRVTVDDALPFYNVLGGTQDNNSMVGPSRTISADGIVNTDWTITQGGDGFESEVEPGNPNIIYAQAQYGNLVRYDKKSGESISIRPTEGKGEAYRWNWNSPLIISPHSPTRLYFAANILFRSDDRGNTWKKVSGDLTRQIDRNKLPVMGKIQSPDAVAKNASTSLFGNIVALTESPKKEGLIYVGTDDGLVQVTEDGGANWRKIETFPGVPNMTYVSFLYASLFDADTVYACFENRKNNDLKPYVLKSSDRGKTWVSLISNLPQRGSAYCIAQDHVRKELLFLGTEFGVYFTIDEGQKWVQLKSGIPTTAVYDMTVQRRENDLVLATFGRGFYILDNYTPLRELTLDTLKKSAHIFSIKDAIMFLPQGARYGQGETYFRAKNPDIGAVFTYFVKEAPKTLKQKRKAEEKEATKKGIPIRYPSLDELRAEDDEPAPFLLFTITDEPGQVVRQLKTPAVPGLQRLTWDLRYPLNLAFGFQRDDSDSQRGGVLVLPGKYSVSISQSVAGVLTPLAGPETFNVVPLNIVAFPAQDRKAMVEFQDKVAELGRAVNSAERVASDTAEKLKQIKAVLLSSKGAFPGLLKKAEKLDTQLRQLNRTLSGDETIAKRNENQPPSVSDRVMGIIYSYGDSTSSPTQTMIEQFQIAGEEFEPLLAKLKAFIEVDMKKFEEELEAARVTWTPGRIPSWKK